MKIYSYKQEAMDLWNQEDRLEAFQPEDYVHLGDFEGRQYFSFNPETVTLAENDEKYDVKVYDTKKKADKEELDFIKTRLTFLKQEVISKKSELFTDLDLFDVLLGIASQDKYIIEKITSLQSDVDSVYKKYGF